MKTISLKKVAAVAVASLGFGLLSVVPAQAAAVAVTSAIKLTASAAPTAGAEVSVTVVASVGALSANSDAATLTAYLSAKPNGAGGAVTNDQTADADNCDYGSDDTSASGTTDLTVTYSGGTCASGSKTFGVVKFTPALPGKYTLTVWNEVATAGLTVGEEVASLDITVAAAAGMSTGATTVLASTTAVVATATTDLAPRVVSKARNTYAGTIVVTVKDTLGALYTGQVITATISGNGYVGGASATDGNDADTIPGNQDTDIDTADGSAVATRTVSVTDTTGVVAFGVWADGTAGTGSVTITVKDKVSEATSTLATKTFTFFGDVAKLAVAATNFTIGKAGSETGKSVAGRTESGEVTNAGALNASTTTPAFVVKLTDSGDRNVSMTAPTVVSSDANVVASGTCTEDNGSSATYSSGGKGFYNCSFTSAVNAASGSKATLTIRTLDPADATSTTYLTTTVAVTIGGSVATETISFDKTSYAPGEAMVITRTAKDSAGNPVADGTAAPAITFSKSVGGTAPGASTYVGGKKATSATTPTVFAPAVAGAFTANATSGNTAGSAITASATVTDANAGLLTQIDALNAKIVALNALIAKIMKKLGVK